MLPILLAYLNPGLIDHLSNGRLDTRAFLAESQFLWNERFGEFSERTRYLNESEEKQELLVEPEGGEGVLTGERWRSVWRSISGTSQSVLFQPHSSHF